MKSFSRIAVQSTKRVPSGLVSNTGSPGKNDVEEDSDHHNKSNKKPRIMTGESECIKLGLNKSSYEYTENEKSQEVDNIIDDEDDLEEFSEYELLQRKNIEERNQFLKTLGIRNALDDFISITNQNNKIKKTLQVMKRSRPKENLPMREPSKRISALRRGDKRLVTDLFESETVKGAKYLERSAPKKKKTVKEQEIEEVDDRLKGTVPLELEDEVHSLLNSFPSLEENCPYDPNIDLASCSIESFRSSLASLRMIGPHQVTTKRIHSLCVHPSVAKQIVLAGCDSGSLGLWDINAGVENDVVEFSYHKAPLNCISVSQFNHCKIYTTSHEGSVCMVDIDHKQCSNVFSTDTSLRIKHLTWHEEVYSNTLLITHGNGNVGVLDLREDNSKISWINCFNQSCRTVQIHPKDTNYFLVSSGTGGCKIFDLRSCPKSICISDLPHPKGLTSAFFSPDGNNILTTCNDDRFRIFDSSLFQENLPKQKNSVVHNNRTGRWLSVFKAKWFPYRSDVYFVGSLLFPRRIQIYEKSGPLAYELRHDDMVTITSVLAVHPKLPLIAGGNSSGKVHVFIPPNSGEA